MIVTAQHTAAAMDGWMNDDACALCNAVLQKLSLPKSLSEGSRKIIQVAGGGQHSAIIVEVMTL